jgi:protein translocase SEC61 complex gamma subunit
MAPSGIFMNINIMPKLRTFFTNSKHILNISYKPSNEEFNRSARIILLGILIIGALGFIISIIIGYLSGAPI